MVFQYTDIYTQCVVTLLNAIMFIKDVLWQDRKFMVTYSHVNISRLPSAKIEEHVHRPVICVLSACKKKKKILDWGTWYWWPGKVDGNLMVSC